jgi:hypothetical protein
MARSRNRYSYNPETGEFTLTGQIYVPSNPSNPISTQYTFSELKKIANSLGVVYEPEDWNTPSLINSWADAGTDPGYYIDPFRRVWLKGTLGTGTSGTVAFNLPVGYRPPQDMYFPVLLAGAVAGGYVLIDTGGDVYITRGAAADATLNGISFRI